MEKLLKHDLARQDIMKNTTDQYKSAKKRHINNIECKIFHIYKRYFNQLDELLHIQILLSIIKSLASVCPFFRCGASI